MNSHPTPIPHPGFTDHHWCRAMSFRRDDCAVVGGPQDNRGGLDPGLALRSKYPSAWGRTSSGRNSSTSDGQLSAPQMRETQEVEETRRSDPTGYGMTRDWEEQPQGASRWRPVASTLGTDEHPERDHVLQVTGIPLRSTLRSTQGTARSKS